MRSIYENKRIPLQLRRLMIFSEICLKAKQCPHENVYMNTPLSTYRRLLIFIEFKILIVLTEILKTK